MGLGVLRAVCALQQAPALALALACLQGIRPFSRSRQQAAV